MTDGNEKRISLRLYPTFSLNKLRPIDFFPPPPSANTLKSLKSICIGTKSLALGDALLLTSLPRKLKAAYPDLKIYTYPLGFNPVAFEGNPFIDGIQYLPKALYGDDINAGSGHLITTKERALGLALSPQPRPEIYLSQSELERATALYGGSKRKIVLVHPWGGTCQNVLKPSSWERAIELAHQKHKDRFTFWQVGLQGHEKINGCDRHIFFKKGFWVARELFALMSLVDGHMGVDSGPMHVASALRKPALIFSDYCEIKTLFDNLKNHPYYMRQNYLRGCLYEFQSHRYVNSSSSPTSTTDISSSVSDFLDSLGSSPVQAVSHVHFERYAQTHL